MEKFKKITTAALAALILFAGGTVGSYIATKYTLGESGVIGVIKETNPAGEAVAAVPETDGANAQPAETEKSDVNGTKPAGEAVIGGVDGTTEISVKESKPAGEAAISMPAAGSAKNPLVAIVKKSSPAVVNIDVESMVTQQPVMNPFQGHPFFDEFFGDDFFGPQQPRKVPRRGKGSGFIVSKEGYILTNNHVVEDADKIRVTMLDGRTFDAKKIGQDPTFDLAVIQIEAKNLPLLPLGDSDATEVGEQVVAIGNSYGFGSTVTSGIISAKNRTLQAPGVNFQGFLQTDAAINPGNSGGPLIDMNGSAIGINTAIIPYAQGIGFAIPINMAKQVMDDLIKHGEVRRGWLGATVQPLTAPLVEAYKIPVKEGSIIADVQPGSPADKSGLQRGDVIVKIGGKEIKTSEDVVYAVRNKLAGDKVKFEIYRDGKKMSFDVTLGDVSGAKNFDGKQKKQGGANQQGPAESQRMGITVVPNSPEFSESHGLTVSEGVVVVSVERGSRGQRTGLRAGDVILEINRQKINGVADWERMMNEKTKNFGFLVSRGGQTLFISSGEE